MLLKQKVEAAFTLFEDLSTLYFWKGIIGLLVFLQPSNWLKKLIFRYCNVVHFDVGYTFPEHRKVKKSHLGSEKSLYSKGFPINVHQKGFQRTRSIAYSQILSLFQSNLDQKRDVIHVSRR